MEIAVCCRSFMTIEAKSLACVSYTAEAQCTRIRHRSITEQVNGFSEPRRPSPHETFVMIQTSGLCDSRKPRIPRTWLSGVTHVQILSA